MNSSNKPNVVPGIFLMLLAAFFSLALILQVFDFGSFAPGQDNIFYFFGKILISVYGFTSSLIPLFLLLASLSCFASKWTAKKSMMLLTAVIPFFTSFGTEKFCRFILSSETIDFPEIKAVVIAIIGLMLIVIEILLAGVFADKVNSLIYGNPVRKTEEKISEFEGEKHSGVREKYHSIKNLLDSENSEKEVSENSLNLEENAESDGEVDAENSFSEENASENIIENAGNSSETQSEIKNDSDEENPFENIFDDYNNDEKTSDDSEIEVLDSVETVENEENNSLLTQEEFQALTFQEDDAETEKDDDSSDELDWPDTAEIKIRSGNNSDEMIIEENSDDEDEIEELEEADDFEDSEEEFLSEDEKNDFDKVEENFDDDDNYSKNEESLNPDFFDIDMNSEESYDDLETESGETLEETKVRENADSDSTEISAEAASAESLTEEKPFDVVPEENEESETEIENSDLNCEDEDSPETVYEDYEEVTAPKKSILADVFADMDEDAQENVQNVKIRFPNYDENAEEIQNETVDSDSEDLNEEELSLYGNKKLESEKKSVDYSKGEGNLSSSVAPKKIIEAPPRLNRNAFRGPYKIPTDIMGEYENDQYWIIDSQTKSDALKLKATLDEFGISAKVIGIKKGPVVTMFELLPAPGVRLSKIVSLQDNIALSLAASSVRIVAPIPGKAAVGIEVPNKKRSIVSFREILEQNLPEFEKMAIPVILGKDILGKSQIIDIARTPHLLIAGATGSGKSVCVNSLILSILYKRSPRDVKLMLIDPKVVELKLYNDIPHLLTPVITEPKRAIQALQYCIAEMERRYSLLDSMGVRDIIGYNSRIAERHIATEKLPYIVVIIDEFADLMATSGKELENDVARLTAKSRAAGIHLVLATQRPSVNVITGLIKANIPSRIAFMVTSRTDSNIIIDSVGAEKLLGKGDMLYASAVDPYPIRIQGTFETDEDVEKVVDFVKTLGEPEYIDDQIFIDDDEEDDGQQNLFSEGDDPLYEQALDVVIQSGKASASYIQRRLRIGYNRAARLVEEMEERGIVGPANGSKPREIIHVPS